MKRPHLRAEAPTIAEHAAVVPAHKLSETVLEFGEPLLSTLGSDAPLVVRQKSLELVIMVWNAVAMAMPLWGKPELLHQFEQTLTQPTAASPTADLLRQLIERRWELYGTDPRTVGEWALSLQPDHSYELRCVAHLPSGTGGAGRNVGP